MSILLELIKGLWIISGFIAMFMGAALYVVLFYGTFINTSTPHGIVRVGDLLRASLIIGYGVGTVFIWLMGIRI